MLSEQITRELTNTTVLAGQVLAIIVTLATVITAITPSRSDNVMMDKVLSFLNLLAGNVGLNKNADEK